MYHMACKNKLFTNENNCKGNSNQHFDDLIGARNASEQNIYIQSAKLNGKVFDQGFIRHTDIMNGGVLEFVMGSKPNK